MNNPNLTRELLAASLALQAAHRTATDAGQAELAEYIRQCGAGVADCIVRVAMAGSKESVR
jgi:hypothetical protein